MTLASADLICVPSQSDIFETLIVCPLCTGSSFEQLPTPKKWIGKDIFSEGEGRFGLRHCRSCSLAFVNPRPSAALLNAFYDSNSYICHKPESGNSATAEFLIECVERHGPYGGKQFLDFGCGGGFLLRAAVERGWDAVGYDVGQRALETCKSQQLNARADLAGFRSGSIDVIFLNHVFEHIAQPDTILNFCRRVLKRDGKLFVVVPNLAGLRARLAVPFLSRRFNVDERHRAFPIHLFYYTSRTLSQILEKNSFRIAAVETFGFGMEEFINRGRVGNGMKAERATPALVEKKNVVKNVLKKSFFGARLGENLLAVACPG